MDCSMPVMNGHEACKKILKMMENKKVGKVVSMIA